MIILFIGNYRIRILLPDSGNINGPNSKTFKFEELYAVFLYFKRSHRDPTQQKFKLSF